MSSYQRRLERVEGALMSADPAARSLVVLYLNGDDETSERAAARYVAERGLSTAEIPRILAEGFFVRFVSWPKRADRSNG